MSSGILALIPFLVAGIFFLGYLFDDKKERMIEKYMWLYVAISLIIFGFWNVNTITGSSTVTTIYNVPLNCASNPGNLSATIPTIAPCGTTNETQISNTVNNYALDPGNNAFGTALGIMFVILTALFAYRIYSVWKP